MDSSVSRMKEVFERQRRAFAAQPYPELAQRKARLKALKGVLRRYQDLIVEAVSADFGCRSGPETRLVEILGPVLEANHAISSLNRWARPSRRHAELLFLINRVWVAYQPKGVVGVITPWNFPLYLSLGPLIAAIAAGNRVMIKMSEFSPSSTVLLARMLGECFDEDEVAVFGGEVDAAIAFSKIPFDHLVFTGSPAVGRQVMRAAADNLTPVTLELGGKSPVLLSPEGSVEDAATRVAHGKAFNSGQVCLAPTTRWCRASASMPSPPRRRRRSGGSIPRCRAITSTRRWRPPARAQRVRDLLADAAAKGGSIAVCGDVGDGAQIPLHVVTGVRDDMRIAGEELFGPILPVIGYDSLDDAIAYINARPRPLGMYPFGFDAAGDRAPAARHPLRRHVLRRLGLARLQPRPALRRHRQFRHGQLPRRRGLSRAVARARGVQEAPLVPDRPVLPALRQLGAEGIVQVLPGRCGFVASRRAVPNGREIRALTR